MTNPAHALLRDALRFELYRLQTVRDLETRESIEANIRDLERFLRGKVTNMLDALAANPKMGNIGDWQGRHNKAVAAPRDFERPLVNMIRAWAEYATRHEAQYESKIGDDGVLGEQWEAIGFGLMGLLNGQSGRLDCGTLDAFIRRRLTANGCESER